MKPFARLMLIASLSLATAGCESVVSARELAREKPTYRCLPVVTKYCETEDETDHFVQSTLNPHLLYARYAVASTNFVSFIDLFPLADKYRGMVSHQIQCKRRRRRSFET